MSSSFNRNTVSVFLTGEGAPSDVAGNVADFVVVAARTTSMGAQIESQSTNEDFTKYDAKLVGVDGTTVEIAYEVKKRGAGFFEHVVNVTHGDQSYGLNRLVFTPQESVEYSEAPVAVAAPEVEPEVDVVADPVEEVAEVVSEAPVVEEITQEVVEVVEQPVATQEPVQDEQTQELEPAAEVKAEDASEEVKAPKAKSKKKSKKDE